MCKITSRHSVPHWLEHLWSLLWCYYSKHMKYNVHETRKREINMSVFFKGTRGWYSGFIPHFELGICSVFRLWKHRPENHMEVKFLWQVWGNTGFLKLLIRVNFEVTSGPCHKAVGNHRSLGQAYNIRNKSIWRCVQRDFKLPGGLVRRVVKDEPNWQVSWIVSLLPRSCSNTLRLYKC